MFFFFKQKTAYEMRISDWSSDVCSSDLIARTYIELFQGTPLMMQLFLVFFGVALAGVEISPWMAAAIALTLFTSAYLAEIWRGCVDAISNGQWEASASLALTPLEQLRYVILPQALRRSEEHTSELHALIPTT